MKKLWFLRKKTRIDVNISCNFTTTGLNCFKIRILILCLLPFFHSTKFLINCVLFYYVCIGKLSKKWICKIKAIIEMWIHDCFGHIVLHIRFHMINAFSIISITLHPKLQLKYISLTLANSIIQTWLRKSQGQTLKSKLFEKT